MYRLKKFAILGTAALIAVTFKRWRGLRLAQGAAEQLGTAVLKTVSTRVRKLSFRLKKFVVVFLY